MIDADTTMYYRSIDGALVVWLGGLTKAITERDYPSDWQDAHAYLAEHPEALVPEPVAPPPSPEELLRQEMAQLLAYLSSTDWYAIRQSETDEEIPGAVLAERANARARISEIRGLL